jgi:hypothetical protein
MRWYFGWPAFNALLLVGVNAAQSPAQDARPIPRVQAIPLPDEKISFQREEKEIARYHFGPTLKRPFIYPVIGPSGRPLTRMGHPGDPYTHSHHNSIWISHSDVNGVDFFSDHNRRNPGRIVWLRTEDLEDGDDRASATTAANWTAQDGRVLLRETRQVLVRLLPNDYFQCAWPSNCRHISEAAAYATPKVRKENPRFSDNRPDGWTTRE